MSELDEQRQRFYQALKEVRPFAVIRIVIRPGYVCPRAEIFKALAALPTELVPRVSYEFYLVEPPREATQPPGEA